MSRRGGRRGSKDLPDDWAPEEESAPAVAQEPAHESAADTGLRDAAAAASESLNRLQYGGERTGSPSTDVAASALEPPDRPHSPATEIMDGSGEDDGPSQALVPYSPKPQALEDKEPSITSSGIVSEGRPERQLDIVRAGSKKSTTSSEFRRLAVEPYDKAKRHSDPSFELEDDNSQVSGQEVQQYEADDESVYSSENADYDSDNDDPNTSIFAWQRQQEASRAFDKEDTGEEEERGPEGVQHRDEEDEMSYINSNRMLAFMCFAVLWVFAAAGLMLALTWHYVWVEVASQAEMAARAAVEQGSLHASEVLLPVTTVARTLDLAFRGGSLTNHPVDGFSYNELRHVLNPFFDALPGLREVEIGDSPDWGPTFRSGSIVMRRLPVNHQAPVTTTTTTTGKHSTCLSSSCADIASGTGMEIMSDRGDCLRVAGGRGCSLEPHYANESTWFRARKTNYPKPFSPEALPLGWYGPEFSRNLPQEAICDDVCWNVTYSLASRISGSIDPDFLLPNTSNRSNVSSANMSANVTWEPYLSVIVRVTMEATVFIEVLKNIQIASRGHAFFCTPQGVLVAAVEMADIQTADPSTGIIEMVEAWNYPQDWAATIEEGDVMAGSGAIKMTGDGEYLVSAWKVDAPHNATKELSDSLRIVLAIPAKAYADSVLQSLRYWTIATSSLPCVFVFFVVCYNIWLRYIRKTKRDLKDMSIDELKELTKKKKAAIEKHKQMKHEEAERLKAMSGFTRQSSVTTKLSSFGRKSISNVFGRSTSSGGSKFFSEGSASSRGSRFSFFHKNTKPGTP